MNFSDSTNTSRFPSANRIAPGEWLNGSNSVKTVAVNAMAGHEYIFDRLYVRIVFYALYSIVFCCCFFGNLAVLLVLTLHWRMRNITNFFLGNLAFSNICVGVFCVYQNLSMYVTESWIFGSFLCKMYHFISSWSHTASILILVAVCVERYVAILHPLACRRILTKTKLRILMMVVWLLSAVISTPRLYYITTYSNPSAVPGERDVICAPHQDLYNNEASDMIHFVLLFLLPLMIMSVLYARVCVVLWHSPFTLDASYSQPKFQLKRLLNRRFASKLGRKALDVDHPFSSRSKKSTKAAKHFRMGREERSMWALKALSTRSRPGVRQFSTGTLPKNCSMLSNGRRRSVQPKSPCWLVENRRKVSYPPNPPPHPILVLQKLVP